MMPLQNTRTAVVLSTVAATTNADSTGYVDTLGFEEGQFDFILGVAANATNVPIKMELHEADDTNSTSFAAFLSGGTNDSFAVTAVSASVSVIARANLDLRKRKRYIKAVYRAGTATQLVSCIAVLGKAKDSTIARGSGTQVSVDL